MFSQEVRRRGIGYRNRQTRNSWNLKKSYGKEETDGEEKNIETNKPY
jgi:hypothetical protein